ncbi:MAG TPA: hypothetical protein VK628_05560 [Flavitalea sp.]|nr:hypothetical protein [Flavitalea sp.]
MKKLSDTQSFPKRDDSIRDQSDREDAEHKEKYLREAGKIEDLPNNEDLEKMNNASDVRNSVVPGREEKNKEDVTGGERVKDLNQRRNSL